MKNNENEYIETYKLKSKRRKERLKQWGNDKHLLQLERELFELKNERKELGFMVKTISGDEEKVLLDDFLKMIHKSFPDAERFHFCGHNIREFDIPFICRRLLINGFELPEMLDFSGVDPML